MFGSPRMPDQLPLPFRQFLKTYPRNIGLFPPPFISQQILPMKMGGVVKRRKRKTKK